MMKKRKSSAPTGRTKAKTAVGDIALTSLAIGAVGVVGYLGWQYVKKRRQRSTSNLDETLLRSTIGPTGTDTITPLPGSTATPPYVQDSITNPLPALPSTGSRTKPNSSSPYGRSSTGGSDDFPMKRGSKGENVRALQEALIRKYGRSILPKYGADGGFGAETAAALKKVKLPATISETLFNVLTQGGGGVESAGNTDVSALGTKLYNAAIRRDFSAAMSLLKNIRSSADYNTVSESFKRYRLNGVRQTLVNGLLNTFKSNSQKEQLRLAFATMGLTYDGSKWSLSGIDGIPIITVRPAQVWVDAVTAVNVPARMVLGHEVARRLQYVLFANRGKYFLVRSECVKPL